MIIVTGPMWLWTGDNGTWHFVTVPAEQSDEVRGARHGGAARLQLGQGRGDDQ